MLERIKAFLHRFPLAKLGGVLVVIGTVVETLDALGQIDIAPVATFLGFDPALVVSAIGVIKIGLRGVLALAAAMSAAKAAS